LDDYKLIAVRKGIDGKQVEVKNPTAYKLIGKGYQGAVFQLNDHQCVKIYATLRDAQNEAKALMVLQQQSLVPKLFETGSNYNIMEFLKGPDLSTYLRKKGSISESISHQILVILKEMERVGFLRVNHRMKHFIVTEQEVLKVIDLANVFNKYDNQPYPIEMFTRLKNMGLLTAFFDCAKKMEPEMYAKWEQAIQFEQL